MRLIYFLLAAQLGCACLAQTIRSEHIALEYREASGARIAFAGVPVIRGSSIQLHAPDWKDGYYSSSSSPRQIRADTDARTIVIRHSVDQKVKFSATETWTLLDDNRIELTITGRLDSDVPARLEWAIGYINAFTLWGGSYLDSWKPGESAHAVVPQALTPQDDPAVLRNTRQITLNTRIGSIRCTVESDSARLTLLDGRLAPQRWWAQETPTFWLGSLGIPVTAGEPFELKAMLEYSRSRSAHRPLAHRYLRPELTQVDRAYVPPQRPIRVIPTPRQMQLHEERFVLPRAASHSEALEAAVVRQVDESMKPESYAIRCDESGVRVRASGDAGFRYARYTLEQLVQVDLEGRAFLPACEIDDEPSLEFRGVHIFPGKDSLEFHRRLVENVIARHKFNHVILECEYTQWDSARGIWVDFSVPKAQIRQYVKMLRDNGLEPIPLVQSLGHMWWMFRNDQNLELAEDPEMPRAYDATNPKTYEFIDRIYEEALELFKPIRYFHIGHDEITLFGRYPHREESKKWGVTKLFLSDIQHWIDFFRPRDIRIMMWGDMLLAKEEIKDGAAFGDSLEEARRRRDALSKDIIICDWHYEPLKPQDYPSLRIFREAGFKAIASTWYNPMNIYGFAEAARREQAWGLLQTTWAGYNITEKTLDEEMRQFAAYILAAEYSWSADSPPPGELPWRADEVLIDAMNPTAPPTQVREGFVAKIEEGVPLKDWLGLGGSADLSMLSAVDSVAGYRFSVSGSAVVAGGVLLPAEAAQPSGASVTIGTSAAELAFLHATAFPAEPGDEVGQYEIRYADGSSERLPLVYGQNIRSWSDPGIVRQARGGWTGTNDDGLAVAARVLVWVNPHPERPIDSITLSTRHAYAAPTLFAVTGTSPP